MHATKIQVTIKPNYERTTDSKMMFTHALLNEAIRSDWKNIKSFLPCRTATYIEYKAGATEAMAWNEGERPTRIYLPLKSGFYVPDGNPYAIPNGKPSHIKVDSEALYLMRDPDGEFSGPLVRIGGWFGSYRFAVDASGGWSKASGVALEPQKFVLFGSDEYIQTVLRLLRSQDQLFMGATAQATIGLKYERTTDPNRMLTNALLIEAISRDWKSIKRLLPCRTATYLEYKAGATEAMAWNEGGSGTGIYLPLKDGWYVPDNPFAIPNGKPSSGRDPKARYLMRDRDREFSGPLRHSGGRTPIIIANDVWSWTSGVAQEPEKLILSGSDEYIQTVLRLLRSQDLL